MASDYAFSFLPSLFFDLPGHVYEYHKTLQFPQMFSLETSQLLVVQVLRLSFPALDLLYGRDGSAFWLSSHPVGPSMVSGGLTGSSYGRWVGEAGSCALTARRFKMLLGP